MARQGASIDVAPLKEKLLEKEKAMAWLCLGSYERPTRGCSVNEVSSKKSSWSYSKVRVACRRRFD